ncbi:hypothetical protein DFJ58DRAFT_444682 [Suillus subalutaceus]|uniref:uncharacterized protein n=1 Tax=Suillus subalutaceus TaxID=48586 RepID=UPI001B862CE4|nr:uncharacterized protein DFJ58DRAFT_444682 [Suillus subalutaceus]KAG1850211.1 hypothetical protein DFJ58DRAFT_444682 [Suillus subalutaceus]
MDDQTNGSSCVHHRYPQQIINFFIVIGLFYLRWKKPDAVRPFKVWWPLAVFFLAAAAFPNGVGDTPPLPYYLYCLIGIAVMLAGVLYWAAWRIMLPKVFGYELVLRKERLDDGTVATTIRAENVMGGQNSNGIGDWRDLQNADVVGKNFRRVTVLSGN